MDDDKLSESTNTQIDQEVITEPDERLETDVSLADSKPKNSNNKSVPVHKNGNGDEKNGQKRIITEPVDGTSKKPRISTPEVSNLNIKGVGDEMDLIKKGGEDKMDLVIRKGGDQMHFNTNKEGGDKKDLKTNEGGGNEIDLSSDNEEYYLTLSNFPKEWTYVQIKNYLDEQCGHVDEMEMLKWKGKSRNCAIRLTFQSSRERTDAFKKLENKAIDGKKLKVIISDSLYQASLQAVAIPPISMPDQDDSTKESTEIKPVRLWRPDQVSWDEDPEGLYGLRPQFLKALNIKPPLNKTVHVTNFRCDKNELKEVMEMAGNVLMCCVVAIAQKYAKVMYSHPLEAVQAISMLHGQIYYGVPLNITMDKNPPESIVLPKGLANIGQGLGLQAKPIRNIVHQYQRYVNNQSSSINPIVFSEIDFSDNSKVKTDENPEEIQKNIDMFLSSRPGCNILNPIIKKFKNIDELDSHDANSKDGSGRSTPETPIISKAGLGASKITSVEPILSPNQNPVNKNGSEKVQKKSPVPATPALGAAPPNPLVRLGSQTGKGFINSNLIQNPPVPMHNPLPMPGPGEPYYGSGNNHQQPTRPFRPRTPFMPLQRPPFPQPMPPTPFGPPSGIRPPIPPVNFNGPRANFNGPRANLANRVTVKFSNLPPSTTFPLLCDQLAQCGQVMSVQLTTPGCAVATFGHPSHAERCFQNFNGINVEGYMIEVNFI